jgi:hypothetical protein
METGECSYFPSQNRSTIEAAKCPYPNTMRPHCLECPGANAQAEWINSPGVVQNTSPGFID